VIPTILKQIVSKINKTMPLVQLKPAHTLLHRFSWGWRTVMGIFSIGVKKNTQQFIGSNLKLERSSSKKKSLPHPSEIFPR
jgi:hypothetical protein